MIPEKLRGQVCDLLHEGHPGVVRMKILARAHVFWPKINDQIEDLVKTCNTYQLVQNVPRNKNVLEWSHTNRVGDRVHVDFLDISGVKIIILVDSYSKWLDAHIMQGSDCNKTIDKLSVSFSTLGYPQEIVTDNGPPFNAAFFENFCKSHGIQLTHTPPYHAKSNGATEKAVQSIKASLKKQLIECKANTSMERKLAKTLMFMRNVPCVKTGLPPASVVLKQLPRTKLSMLRPELNRKKHASEGCKEIPSFTVGQVFVRATQNKLVKWWPSEIVAKRSPATYVVKTNGTDRLYHIEEIKQNVTEQQSRAARSIIQSTETLERSERPLEEALLRNETQLSREENVNDSESVEIEPTSQTISSNPAVVANNPRDSISEGPVVRRFQRVTRKPDRFSP